MKITTLRMHLLKLPRIVPKATWFSVNPAHIFPDLQPGSAGRARGNRPDIIVLEVETDDGIHGLANTNMIPEAVHVFIQNYLAPLVIGADPMRSELLWEKLARTSIMAGRDAATIAISLIDIALWDIKGKALGQPVYNLLGGKTKDRIRAYASRLYGPDLGALREEAAMYVQQGFTAMKQRFAFGPAHGLEGMKRNRQMVEAVRRTIGDDIELMVDCCRSFDAVYAIKMLRMVEEFGLSFAEEPVLPHDHAGYVQVRKAVSMPIAGGEFEFGRYAFRRWADMGCADIWQPDGNRVGGISELQKIAHLGASFDVPVVPHGGQMHNYQVIMASMNMPLAEYFPPPVDKSDGNAFYYYAIEGEPQAKDGYLELPETPGMGLTLNRQALKDFKYDG